MEVWETQCQQLLLFSLKKTSTLFYSQFAPPKNSANISLNVTFFVMKQRLVPSGSASTSAIHVDVNYQRGPQECSQTLHSYRDVEIVVYQPGQIGHVQLSFIHFFYFLYTFSFYISFSGVDKKNQIPCMHPLIPSQNLFVSLLADTRISLTIISFGKSITIMINIRRIMCL